MTQTNTGRALVAAIAAATILTLGGCGDDTESIPSDQAEDELGDLQDEIDEKLDEAGEAVDEGVARGQAELFKQQLTELGGDDTPSRAVADLESIASDLPGDAGRRCPGDAVCGCHAGAGRLRDWFQLPGGPEG